MHITSHPLVRETDPFDLRLDTTRCVDPWHAQVLDGGSGRFTDPELVDYCALEPLVVGVDLDIRQKDWAFFKSYEHHLDPTTHAPVMIERLFVYMNNRCYPFKVRYRCGTLVSNRVFLLTFPEIVTKLARCGDVISIDPRIAYLENIVQFTANTLTGDQLSNALLMTARAAEALQSQYAGATILPDQFHATDVDKDLAASVKRIIRDLNANQFNPEETAERLLYAPTPIIDELTIASSMSELTRSQVVLGAFSSLPWSIPHVVPLKPLPETDHVGSENSALAAAIDSVALNTFDLTMTFDHPLVGIAAVHAIDFYAPVFGELTRDMAIERLKPVMEALTTINIPWHIKRSSVHQIRVCKTHNEEAMVVVMDGVGRVLWSAYFDLALMSLSTLGIGLL